MDYENNAVSFRNSVHEMENVPKEKEPQDSDISSNFRISNVRTWNLMQLFNVTKHQSQRKLEIALRAENVKLHGNNKKLFYHVIQKDLNGLRKHLDKKLRNLDPKDVKSKLKNDRNSVGANIIHHAYLIEAYDIAHWLVETFPEVALEPYSHVIPDEFKDEFEDCTMPYAGENILHMVIVRRNLSEVRWLLDFYRDHKDSVPNGLKILLVANATGHFFDISGDNYFGGYPLQFAVCSNDIEIFDLVLSFASSMESDDSNASEEEFDGASTACRAELPAVGPKVLFMRDSYGNTVLHLCVMHCLKDMFDHVYKTGRRIIAREIKLLYSKSFDVCSEKYLNYEPFEKKSEVRAGYHLYETDVQLPRAEKNVTPVNENQNLNDPTILSNDLKKFEEWVNDETNRKLNERLLSILNNDLHSILTMAAIIKQDDTIEIKDRKIDMLKYLLSKLKSTLWTFGKIQCSEIDLEGLDVYYDLGNYDIKPGEKLPTIHSAISWLCILDVEEAIMIPEIRRIIEIKWERCGYIYFLKGFVLDSVIVVLLTLILAYDNYQPTTHFIDMNAFIDVLYAAVCLIFIWLVGFELYTLLMRKAALRSVRGMARFHVVCRIVETLSFIAFLGSKLNRLLRGDLKKCSYDDTAMDFADIKIPLVVCVMTAWMHLYYYLMGIERTGLFVITLARIVTRDVPYFRRFYLISLFAFASAISLLGNTGNYHTHFSFMRYLKTLWTLIHETVNLTSPDDQTNLLLVPEDLRWLSDMMNAIFYYSVGIVLLNLLIAIINSTYSFYTSYNDKIKGYNNEAILLIEKANVMNYFERHLSPDDIHEYRDKYSMIKQIKPIPLAKSEDDEDEQDGHSGHGGGFGDRNSIDSPPLQPITKWKYFFQLQDKIPGWGDSV